MKFSLLKHRHYTNNQIVLLPAGDSTPASLELWWPFQTLAERPAQSLCAVQTDTPKSPCECSKWNFVSNTLPLETCDFSTCQLAQRWSTEYFAVRSRIRQT
jgi:hypothetical protein